jgi:membrane-associated protein
MEYRRFVFYNVAGGIGWVVTMTSLGYFLGKAVPGIDRHIDVVIAVVIFLSLLPAIIKLAREKWKVRRTVP